MRRALRVTVSRHSPGTAAIRQTPAPGERQNELSLARNKGHLLCLVFGSGQSQTQDGYISRAIERSLGRFAGTEALLCPYWYILSVSKSQRPQANYFWECSIL